MGWLGVPGMTKAELARDQVCDYSSAESGYRRRVLARRWGTVNSNVLWSLERVWNEKTKSPIETFVVCNLFEGSGRDWRIKVMDESMGPCFYDCPKDFLLASPTGPQSEFSESWRRQVWEFWDRHDVRVEFAKSLKVGDTVTLIDATPRGPYRVARPYPNLAGWLGSTLYRLRVRNLALPESAEEAG